MAIISKNEIIELSKVHQLNCISIFIPAHRAGQDTLKGKDALMLKNQVKILKVKLEQHGLGINEVERLLKPVNDLIDDSEFWRHQSDGLAIFLTNGFFKKYTVPIYFEAFNYLSQEFYLHPLIPLFNEDGRFYLLILKKEGVKLFEETRYLITEIKIDDLIPSRIEDIVGYDYEEKNLQFRTQQRNIKQAIFHGHGETETEAKTELSNYFRAINKGIMTLLHEDQSLPLVVACLDFHFPIYKEVNTYKNLFHQHLSGNPADNDILLLHEKTWDLVQPYFSKYREGKFNLFLQYQDTDRTSSDIQEILPAALEGKIDTLFLQNKTDVYGIYDPERKEVDIQEEHHLPNVSLINLIAINVFLQEGKVYFMEKDDMPVGFSKINALYRY